MTLEELNSYRLTSLEEPTDEMLAFIMKEAAQNVARENEEAMRKYMLNLKENARKAKDEWLRERKNTSSTHAK